MIGTAITALIRSSSEISSRINNGANLYPISDYDKGTDAIYYIVRALPGYTKNGATMTKWMVTLLPHSNRYSLSWELSMLLKELFDNQQQKTHAGIKFTHIKCNSITDDEPVVAWPTGPELLHIRVAGLKVDGDFFCARQVWEILRRQPFADAWKH